MLRICPACDQSVLDEDVTECPFCGASMSGKPGAKKPAPTSASPRKSPRKKPEQKPKDDNPFDQPPAKSATAIQAAPKPMKGRLMKVVCPMCDVPGFVPKKAAGRDVRCPNKKCMVPIFKAPELKKRVEEPEEAPKSSSPIPIIAGVVLLLVAAGVGYALMGGGDDSGTAKYDPLPQKTGPASDPTPEDNPPAQPVKEAKTAFALREEVFELLQEAAEGNSKEDRPFCRRMEAEGFAVMGKDAAEVAAKARLIDVNTSQDHFEAFPLLDVAWQQIENGEDAGSMIKQALVPARGVSAVGRSEFDIRIALAAAMAAEGKQADAVETLTSARSLEQPLDLEAARAAGALAISMVAADKGAVVPDAVTEWQNPLWSATAVVLCIRGQVAAAVELAKTIEDKQVRADTLAAIASVEAANGRTATEAVNAASEPAELARVNAGAAYGASGTDKARADRYLDAAVAAAEGLPEPKPMPAPSVKLFYESEYPEEMPSVLACLAYGEIARAEASLGRQAAAETLLKAIYHAHSFCHPPAFSRTWSDRLGNARKLQATLARELNLNEQATRDAANRFKRKVNNLEQRVKTRTALESDLLAQVAASKLAGNAWALTNPATIKDSLLNAERLTESTLPWRVAIGMLRFEDKDAIAAAKALRTAPDVVLNDVLNAYSVVNTPARAGRSIAPPRGIQISRLRPILQLVDRYVAEDPMAAVDFARSIQNDGWSREMLRLVGSRIGRSQEVSKLDEIVAGLKLESPERTAIYRGLLTGLTYNPEFKSPAK